MISVLLHPIWYVGSELDEFDAAPPPPDEGAPDAWMVVDDGYAPAPEGVTAGVNLPQLTLLHRANHQVLAVEPPGNASLPRTGIFPIRAPHRLKPIGLHDIRNLSISDTRIRVGTLEALDGTPILKLRTCLTPDH